MVVDGSGEGESPERLIMNATIVSWVWGASTEDGAVMLFTAETLAYEWLKGIGVPGVVEVYQVYGEEQRGEIKN